MRKALFVILFSVISINSFAQDWSWEIKEVGKKKDKTVDMTFVMVQKFESEENAAGGEFTIPIPIGFIRNKIYPNMPSDRIERLKDLKGLRFDKDPRSWDTGQQIYPY
jgi:hypothetical protein